MNTAITNYVVTSRTHAREGPERIRNLYIPIALLPLPIYPSFPKRSSIFEARYKSLLNRSLYLSGFWQSSFWSCVPGFANAHRNFYTHNRVSAITIAMINEFKTQITTNVRITHHR